MDRRGFFRSIAALGASVVVPGLAKPVQALEAEALLPAATKYVDILLTAETFPFRAIASVWVRAHGGQWERHEQHVGPGERVVIRVPLAPEATTEKIWHDPTGQQHAYLKDGALLWGAQLEQAPYQAAIFQYVPTTTRG